MILGPFSSKQLLLALSAVSSVSAQTSSPTVAPSVAPTKAPSKSPSQNPTASPSKTPTKAPSKSPTTNPTNSPTRTCMVTTSNGTTYTASDYASATSGVDFDPDDSVLTCSEGRGRGYPIVPEGSCKDIEVEYCTELDCTQDYSCYNATTANVPTVKCDGVQACSFGNIQTPSYLLCQNVNACTRTSISLDNSAQLECESGGCINAKVSPTDTGNGITVKCQGSSLTCTGDDIDVGEGLIQCERTSISSSRHTCSFVHFQANCLRCENDGSCGTQCSVNTGTENLTCSNPKANTYGPCDTVPTGSPTISAIPTVSMQPTVAGCRVIDRDGTYYSAQEFAYLYDGVSLSTDIFGLQKLDCDYWGDACQNITVMDCYELHCYGENACYGITSTNNKVVKCMGESSSISTHQDVCMNAKISSAFYVLCQGNYACRGATIKDPRRYLGSSPYITCDSSYGLYSSPCYRLSIESTTNNATLYCEHDTACDNGLVANLTEGNVVCAGVFPTPYATSSGGTACKDVRFISNCLACIGISGTACGSNCQYVSDDDSSSSSCETTDDYFRLGTCPWPDLTSGAIPFRQSLGTIAGSFIILLSFVAL